MPSRIASAMAAGRPSVCVSHTSIRGNRCLTVVTIASSSRNRLPRPRTTAWYAVGRRHRASMATYESSASSQV